MTKPTVQTNKNLKALNTMALSVNAAYYLEVNHTDQLTHVSQLLNQPHLNSQPLYLLGGGSNVIFNGDVNGVVVHVNNKGVRCLSEDENNVYLQVEAGEVWDEFVVYCVQNGYSGIENLSLIPGTVGAAPIQNIGAYGQEVGEIIEQVNCVDLYTLQRHIFSRAECAFDYRTSRFKRKPQQGLLVESVVFKLNKSLTYNINYKPLNVVFKDKKPSLSQLRDAVINIRESKLPNPAVLANTGSFFQNPIVSQLEYERLMVFDANIPAYPQADGSVKLAAAYLIEKCGFKGLRYFDNTVGMHAQQALVLVNYGAASAEQVLTLAANVKQTVLERFQVSLEQEPVII